MYDCVIIGAGQSGLACGHLLAQAGLRYVILDRAARVGDVWRDQRPHSLKLFTSRQFCRLDHEPMEGDPNGFPSGIEFGDYLERFARIKNLDLGLGKHVVSLTHEDGRFHLRLQDGSTMQGLTVINAAGSNQKPVIPAFASKLKAGIKQLSITDYRDPSSVAEAKSVLIVGDGASGRQVADELSKTHRVLISRGRKRKLVPNTVLGRDIFWWLNKAKFLYAPSDSLIGKLLRKRDPIPAKAHDDRALKAQGVVLKKRATDTDGSAFLFEDGTRESVDAVIWCIGYEEDMSWIKLPEVRCEKGHVVHDRGKTAHPGFYLMGRKWLTCRASELVLGVNYDAPLIVSYVKEHVADHRKSNLKG